MTDPLEQAYPRPLSGRAVGRLPRGLVPARAPLEGRQVRLEPLDPEAHCAELYAVSHGSEAALRIWDYLPEGPWPSEAAYLQALRDTRPRRSTSCSTASAAGSPAGSAAARAIWTSTPRPE